MPSLKLEVEIFDPAVPFVTQTLKYPAIDTWHKHTLITKEARRHLSQVLEEGTEELALSGGMYMEVPSLEIGIKIGTIRIDRAKVLVVDQGDHEILLGSEIVNRAFKVGKSSEEDISVSNESKEDPTALSIELHPVNMPFDIRHFEAFLRAQRRLFNMFLLLEGEVQAPGTEQIQQLLDDDERIEPAYRLQLSWIDSGSIWLSLKSGSQKTLRRLGSLFDTSASAKLAQQMADAKKAETEASISQDVRDATAARLREEQEMLRVGNIKKTYDTWRREVKARIRFMDDLLSEIDDECLREELRVKKNAAIAELAEQQILPLLKNFPRPYEPPDGVLLLSRDL